MRLPGFFHLKKDPFQTKIIEESGQLPISFQKFIDAFKITITTETKDFPENNFNLENSVLKSLSKQELLIQKESLPIGCWTIRCPWSHLHSSENNIFPSVLYT